MSNLLNAARDALMELCVCAERLGTGINTFASYGALKEAVVQEEDKTDAFVDRLRTMRRDVYDRNGKVIERHVKHELEETVRFCRAAYAALDQPKTFPADVTAAKTFLQAALSMQADAPDQYLEALDAIRARVEGEFDHPALVKIGPLGDTLSDITRILRGVGLGPEGPEKALRELWTRQGVPKEKQDTLEKAKPGAKIGPWTIGKEGKK